MSQRDASLAIKQALTRSVPKCFNEDEITLHCNQSQVSIKTDVSEGYMLQVKVNRRNYNSYVVIVITWFRQSTAQLK